MSLTLNLPVKTSDMARCTRDLHFERQLGQGAFGQVYKARVKRTGKIVAVKVNIEKEVWIHCKLRHPHVVRMLDFFQEGDRVYMLLEYVSGGNLFKYMTRHRKLGKDLIKKIFGQTVHAVKYIHQEGFLLRDLKPENMLLDQDLNVKVCDFGWAVSMSDHNLRKARAGTYAYMSPESLMGNLQDQKTDLWSLGILLYELHMGREPFPGKSSSDMLHLISNQPIKFSSKFFTRESMNLVKSLLKFKPFKRINIESLLNSHFLRKYAKINFTYKNETSTQAAMIKMKTAPLATAIATATNRPFLTQEQSQTYGSINVTKSSGKNFSFDPPGKIFTSRFGNLTQKAGQKGSGVIQSKQKFMHSDYFEEPFMKTLVKNSNNKNNSRREANSLSLYQIHDQTKKFRGRNRLTSRGKRNLIQASPAKIQIKTSNKKLKKKKKKNSSKKRRQKQTENIQTPKTIRKNQKSKNLQILLQENSNQSLGFLSKEEANAAETSHDLRSNFHFQKPRPILPHQLTPNRFKKETATTKLEPTPTGSHDPKKQHSFKTRTFNSHKGKDLLSISVGKCGSTEMEKYNSISVSGGIKIEKNGFSENKDFKSEENHFVKSQRSNMLKNQFNGSKASQGEKLSDENDEKRKFDEYADNNSKKSSPKQQVLLSKMLTNNKANTQPMTKSMVNWMKYHQDPYQRNKNYLLDSNSKISLETKAFGDSFGNMTLGRKGDDSIGGIGDSEVMKKRETSIDSYVKMSSSCVKKKKRGRGTRNRPSLGQSPVGRALALLKKQMLDSKVQKARKFGENSNLRRDIDHQNIVKIKNNSKNTQYNMRPNNNQKMGFSTEKNDNTKKNQTQNIQITKKRETERRKTEDSKQEYNLEMRKINYQRLKKNIMKQKIQKMVAQNNLTNLKNELEKIHNRSKNDEELEYKISKYENKNSERGRSQAVVGDIPKKLENEKINHRKNRKFGEMVTSPPRAALGLTRTATLEVAPIVHFQENSDSTQNKNNLFRMLSHNPPNSGLVHTVRIINRSISRKNLSQSKSKINEPEVNKLKSHSTRKNNIPQKVENFSGLRSQNSEPKLIPKQISEYGELMKAATMEIKKKDRDEYSSLPSYQNYQFNPNRNLEFTKNNKRTRDLKKNNNRPQARKMGKNSGYQSQFSLLKAEKRGSHVRDIHNREKIGFGINKMPSLSKLGLKSDFDNKMAVRRDVISDFRNLEKSIKRMSDLRNLEKKFNQKQNSQNRHNKSQKNANFKEYYRSNTKQKNLRNLSRPSQKISDFGNFQRATSQNWRPELTRTSSVNRKISDLGGFVRNQGRDRGRIKSRLNEKGGRDRKFGVNKVSEYGEYFA